MTPRGQYDPVPSSELTPTVYRVAVKPSLKWWGDSWPRWSQELGTGMLSNSLFYSTCSCRLSAILIEQENKIGSYTLERKHTYWKFQKASNTVELSTILTSKNFSQRKYTGYFWEVLFSHSPSIYPTVSKKFTLAWAGLTLPSEDHHCRILPSPCM